MHEPLFTTAPKTIKQRFASQVGKFNTDRDIKHNRDYSLTFDRSVENRVNLHVGSPDTEAVASVLYREITADNAAGYVGTWFSNDGQEHSTLREAAEHLIANRAQPRTEADIPEQGHPSEGPFEQGVGKSSLDENVEAILGMEPGSMQENARLDVLADEFMTGKQIELRRVDFAEVEKRVMARLAAEGRNAQIKIVGDADRATRTLGAAGAEALLSAIGAADFSAPSRSRYYHTPRKTEHVQGPGRPAQNGQHKGSKDAKKAARSAQKMAKASRKARRARKMEHSDG